MATIQVSNETTSSVSRVTRQGRTITYALHVIQQPERARACGSGAKSSADRRPVDPPPIVELRVFGGDGPTQTDITYPYGANFFLFATLEHARAIVPGRGATAATSATNYPVLTGTPVAGMAYLDRPSPAGYFIFPDLSVRHEGKYRLSFALYEELKDAKDMDADAAAPSAESFVSHRLEVKSAPFTVFSAKKFPGLAQSTSLSRTVAEQGCRVRIRRDVRMRRRENKPSKDWDDYEKDAYEHARRTATPDAYGPPAMATPQPVLDDGRPRSVSNASNASYAPPRRPSMEDLAQAYSAPGAGFLMAPPPPPPPTGYVPVPQYASSPHQFPGHYGPPMMQPPPAYSTGHVVPTTGVHVSYGYPTQPHYEAAPPPRVDADYVVPAGDYRRPSLAPAPYPPPIVAYGVDAYSRPQQMHAVQQPLMSPQQMAPGPPLMAPPQNVAVPVSSAMHMASTHGLTPLKTMQPAERLEPVSPSYQTPTAMSAPPLPVAPDPKMAPAGYRESMPSPLHGYAPQQTVGAKRSFSSSFDTQHVTERLQQGARPNLAGPSYGFDAPEEADVEEGIGASAMSYRRADGTQRQRRVPSLPQ